MFKIGEFSKLANLTVRALHHYEKLGLLLPEKVDEDSSYRFYSASQLIVVNRIKTLQQIGLPLKVIKKVMDSDNVELLEDYYDLREKEIAEELKKLKIRQAILKELKEKMKEGSYMEKYNVEVKKLPKRTVMSIRRTIPTYADECQLWQELYEEFVAQDAKMTTPPFGMTIYHDSEYKEKDVEVEIQSSIIGSYKDTEKVKFYDTEEFTMASVTFNGSYEQMPEVTQAIAAWIEANNYIINGPMVNIAHVSSAQDPNPENWVTEAGFMVCERK